MSWPVVVDVRRVGVVDESCCVPIKVVVGSDGRNMSWMVVVYVRRVVVGGCKVWVAAARSGL